MCVCVRSSYVHNMNKKSAAEQIFLSSHISHKNESRDDYRTYVSHTTLHSFILHSRHTLIHTRVLFGTKSYYNTCTHIKPLLHHTSSFFKIGKICASVVKTNLFKSTIISVSSNNKKKYFNVSAIQKLSILSRNCTGSDNTLLILLKPPSATLQCFIKFLKIL